MIAPMVSACSLPSKIRLLHVMLALTAAYGSRAVARGADDASRPSPGQLRGWGKHGTAWAEPEDAAALLSSADGRAAVADSSRSTGVPDPPDMAQLECAIHQLAYQYGTSIVTSSPRALHDALNLANCSHYLGEAAVRANQRSFDVSPSEVPPPSAVSNARSTFFVSPDGSDTAPGTLASPFESLHRAAAAAREAAKPVVINLRKGKYHLNSTLELHEPDSYAVWTAYQGEKVVLSGGLELHPEWKQYKDKIWQAAVPGSLLLSTDEQRYWSARRKRDLDNSVVPTSHVDDRTELPPAPAGWQRFPGHCMSEKPCTAAFCNCASRPYILDWAPGGFNEAQAACMKDRRCTAFALLNYDTPASARFETYAGLRNESAVANSDWNAYAMVCVGTNCKPTPAPPSPVPPPPTPTPPPGPHEWGAPPALANTLFVNGVRQVRARFPNANPQDGSGICFSAKNRPGEGCAGYLAAKGGGGVLPSGNHVASLVMGPNRGTSPTYGCTQCADHCPSQFHYSIYSYPEGHPVYTKPMPGLGWTNNSLFSFWGSPFSRPSSVQYGTDVKRYSDATTAVIHMFHGSLWGGWQFQVASQQANASTFKFGYGGYQEARGSGIKPGQHYFIENVIEELDTPGEWYLDPKTDPPMLYFWPNFTSPIGDGATGRAVDPPTAVTIPVLETLVRIDGARNVSFAGIEFVETRATFLDQYEIPSGGDWSIHRGATFLVTNAQSVELVSCKFNQTGGNAVMLSGNCTNSSVSHCEFVHTGDSAIVLLGLTDAIDATKPTYPNHNLVANNHIREVGVFGKQTSCIFHALAANTTVRENVCYNGPRAGINWNDGHGGNNVIERNLVFGMVRETGAGTGVNAGLQPYWTMNGVNDGFRSPNVSKPVPSASIIKKLDFIRHNFLINGYNSVWTIDHDDGSQFFNDTHNLMVWGGCKNYIGNSKSCDNNIIVHPGISSRSAGSYRCACFAGSGFANQYFENNTCLTTDGDVYSFGFFTAPKNCTEPSIAPAVYVTRNNTFFVPRGVNISSGRLFGPGQPCASLHAWQAAGQDAGTRVLSGLPSVGEVVAMGKAVLAKGRDTFEHFDP